jgi:endonuclease/exonuclease/phosphatase family metal-dependent hydrolase
VTPAAPLRVATFNIRNGRAFDWFDSWPFRRRATAEAVARLDADLVGLQEVYGFQQRYLLRRLPGYRATGAGRGDGRGRGERCAVLYRSARLALDDSVTRWFSDTPDMPGSTSWGNRLPRIVTLIRLTDTASGARFGFADCHLEGWPAAARHRSAAALVGWLDPALPWIVAGDFNAEPDDQAARTMTDAGLRDVFTIAAPAAAGHAHVELGALPQASQPALERDARAANVASGPTTTTGGFAGTGERRRIDYLFVSRHWTVDEAAVATFRRHRRLPSDHWPVVATVRLAADPA